MHGRALQFAPIVLSLLCWSAPAQGACPTPLGDINASGMTDVVDVQCGIITVLHALVADPAAPLPTCLGVPIVGADIDCNGKVDVVDVLLIIFAALGEPLSPDLDLDADGCPDACDPIPPLVCPAGQQPGPGDDTTAAGCILCPPGAFKPLAGDGKCAASDKLFGIYLHETQNQQRVGQPVSGGIPFAEGAVFDANHIHLFTPDGKKVAVQAHPLGIRWHDGSLKWALLNFEADGQPGETSPYVLVVDPSWPKGPPAEFVQVKDTPGDVELNTGPMRIKLSKTDFGLPSEIWIGEELVLAEKPTIALTVDHEQMSKGDFFKQNRPVCDLYCFGLNDTGLSTWGKVDKDKQLDAVFAGPVSIEVEEAGPLRAVVRVESAQAQAGGLSVVARIYAYAGKTYFRVELSVINHDVNQFVDKADDANPCCQWTPQCDEELDTEGNCATDYGNYKPIVNTKHVKDYTFTLVPELGGADKVILGTAAGEISADAAQGVSFLQSVDEDLEFQAHITTQEGTETLAEQLPGWMEVTGAIHSVGVAAKYFWEAHPKQMAFDPQTGGVEFSLWPSAFGATYPLSAGRMKTYEFVIGFDSPAAVLSTLARDDDFRPYPLPEYVASTLAGERFVPIGTEGFSRYDAYVAKTWELADAVTLYGDLDWGDQIGWTDDQRWNGYHGVSHEWMQLYFASGDPKFYKRAEANVWHAVDVDTVHTGNHSGARDNEFARAFDHRFVNQEFGNKQHFLHGDVYYYFLTGKRRILESLERTSARIPQQGGGSVAQGSPDRYSSLSLLALAKIYEVIGSDAALDITDPCAIDGSPTSTASPSQKYLKGVCELNTYLMETFQPDADGEVTYDNSPFQISYAAEAFHQVYKLFPDKQSPPAKAAAEGILLAAQLLYQNVLPTGMPHYSWPKCHANAPFLQWHTQWDEVEGPAAYSYLITGEASDLEHGEQGVDMTLLVGSAYSSGGPNVWKGAMGMGTDLATYLWALRDAGLTEDDVLTQGPAVLKPGTADFAAALCEMKNEVETYYVTECGAGQACCACPSAYSCRIHARLAAEVGRVLYRQVSEAEGHCWLCKWKGKPYSNHVQQMLDRLELTCPFDCPAASGPGECAPASNPILCPCACGPADCPCKCSPVQCPCPCAPVECPDP